MPSGSQASGFVPVAAGVCSGSTWQRILVVSSSPVFDIIQWYQDGGMQDPNIKSYLKTHLLTGVAVPLTLFALVLLFFILFLIWRVVKCACFSTARVRANPLAEITAPWLKAQQALVVVFMMAAISLSVVGMIKLPADPLSSLDNRAQATLHYGSVILDHAEGALNSIRSLNASLDGVQHILDTDVDAQVMINQLQEVQPFVQGLPQPAPMHAALVALHGEVHNTLGPTVTHLQQLVSTGVDIFEPSVQKVAKLPALLRDVQAAIDNLDHRFSMLPRDYSASAGTTGMAVALLKTAHDAVRLNAWDAQMTDMLPALDNIDAARDDELLPGIMDGCQKLSGVQKVVTGSLDVLLPGLQQLDALNPETLLPLVPDLVGRLEHINQSVVVLDNDIAQSVQLLHLAESHIKLLYPDGSGTSMGPGRSNSITSLPAWISQLQALQDQITDVHVVQALQVETLSPSQQVDDMPDSSGLRQAMADLQVAFSDLQQPLAAVSQALLQHMSSDDQGTYDQLLAAADKAAGFTAAMVVLLSFATNKGSEPYFSTVLELTDSLAGLHNRMSEGQRLLQGIAEQVAEAPADIAAGLDMLDTLSDVYKQLPTPVDQVFDAPLHLLEDTVDKASNSLKDVRQQIAETLDDTSSKVQKARAQDLPDLERLINQTIDQARKYWRYAYAGLMSGYGAIILLVILLGIFSLVRCPAGLIISAGLLLLWLSLWLLGSIVGMAGLVVLQDLCTFAERLIVSQVVQADSRQDGSAGVLLSQYYLFHQGSSSISDVLRLANVVDINQAVGRMTSAQSSLLSNLQEKVQLTPQFSATLMEITSWVETIQSQASELVALIEFEPVSELYKSIKSCLCCELGAQIMVTWVCVTCSGMLAWLAVVVARLVIRRLDVLPRDNCLGCQCYWAVDYQAPSQEVKRRFWNSWGGAASSAGGSTNLASFGGASSMTGGGVKAFGIPGSSSGGGTSSSNSSGGQRVSSAGDTQRQSVSAWWKLVHPHAWHTLKNQDLREEDVHQEFTTIVSTPVDQEVQAAGGIPAVTAPSTVQMTGMPRISSAVLPIYVEAGHHVMEDADPSAPCGLHLVPSNLQSASSSDESPEPADLVTISTSRDSQSEGTAATDASCHQSAGEAVQKELSSKETSSGGLVECVSVSHEVAAPNPAEEGPTAPLLEVVAPAVEAVPHVSLEMDAGDVDSGAAPATQPLNVLDGAAVVDHEEDPVTNYQDCVDEEQGRV